MSTLYSCYACGINLPDGENADTLSFPDADDLMPVCDTCRERIITVRKAEYPANLLNDILAIAGSDTIGQIVFNYQSWEFKDDYRFSWIQPKMPYTFEGIKHKLDVYYNDGFGGEDFPPFWAWSENGKFVYICSCYDGSTRIHQIPASLHGALSPQFYGGG